MYKHVLNLMFIIYSLCVSVYAISDNIDKDFKIIPVSKIILECHLNGETISRNYSEKFNDRITLNISSEYSIFPPDRSKDLYFNIYINGGKDIIDLYIHRINNKRSSFGQYIKVDDDEYFAQKEDNGRSFTITLNRHTGILNYDFRSLKNIKYSISANGNCEKITNKKL